MKKTITILCFLSILFSFKTRADEGMWLLPLIEKLNIGKMTEMGLKLSAEDIYSLNKASIKDAIIIFGRGCTGEIVSPQGLILTNHHCGYSSIQSHSSIDHDYLRDGFWAKTMDDELPDPELSVQFLIKIEDVTPLIMANVKDGMSETERTDAISGARLAIQRKASENNNYSASVVSFYGGNYFYLLLYEIYNDVRLVGAPPSSIGKYGSDTDNWEWPRHTCDFSVFRVYTGPDGKPADYSKENIPLKPKYFLPVSIKDINKGDFAMILGYPGRTSRYATSYEINEILNVSHPARIKIRGIKQESWMEDMKADQKINIQYSDKYFVSSNYWKNFIGQKEGLEKLNVMAEKQELEDQFRKWISADQSRKDRYGDILEIIKSSVEGRSEIYKANIYLSECFAAGCELLGYYQVASALISSLQTGDATKTTELTDKIKNVAGELYKDYNPSTDKKTMKLMLKLFRADVPEKYHPDFYANLIDKKFKGNIDRFTEDVFARSVFSDMTRLTAFLSKPVLKTLENDPLYIIQTSIIKAAAPVSRELTRIEEDLSKGRRLWQAALMEMDPGSIRYPDANFTMRLSYGSVQDYEPRDGVNYKYYTTMKGVLEKYKPGDYEFDLPRRQIELYNRNEYGRYASSKGYMPACFLTTNDITGGNSGSPVLNGDGHLTGLAFDGNWEAVSGDYDFEPDLQRTIVVDIRYVLWVMDIYAGARHLVDEMTIVQ